MATFRLAVGDPRGGPQLLSDSSMELGRAPPSPQAHPSGPVSVSAPQPLIPEAVGRICLPRPDLSSLAGCGVEIQARCSVPTQAQSWWLSRREEIHFVCLRLKSRLGECACPRQHLPQEAPGDCSLLDSQPCGSNAPGTYCAL